MKRRKIKPRYRRIKSLLVIAVLTLAMMGILTVDQQCHRITGEGGMLGFSGEKNSAGDIKAYFFGVDISSVFR